MAKKQRGAVKYLSVKISVIFQPQQTRDALFVSTYVDCQQHKHWVLKMQSRPSRKCTFLWQIRGPCIALKCEQKLAEHQPGARQHVQATLNQDLFDFNSLQDFAEKRREICGRNKQVLQSLSLLYVTVKTSARPHATPKQNSPPPTRLGAFPVFD